MKKPIDLRAHLTTHVPSLARHPDKLHVFIEKGSVATKRGAAQQVPLGCASHSFEYRYTLQLLIEDYTEPADTLIVPLLAWIDTNQPDLIDDTAKRDKAIGIEAELLDHQAADIALTLELSERVIVTAVTGGWSCNHLGEPPLPDLGGPRSWDIYLDGEPL